MTTHQTNPMDRMNWLLPLYRVLAVIESLPRNEFGDDNYLALDHAYRRCVEIIQTEIALQVQDMLTNPSAQ